MKLARSSALALALLIAFPALATAQDSLPLAHHVSGNMPVQASPTARELSAERPFVPPVAAAQPRLDSPAAHNWKLQATILGAVIHDLSFVSPKVGYAAAEGGQIWKTTNGGTSWSEVLNLGYPYYFYGVAALNANDVVISGFYDTTTFFSLIRWSHDGGQT